MYSILMRIVLFSLAMLLGAQTPARGREEIVRHVDALADELARGASP